MNQFILIDCNNFYASCQKIFDPSLDECPIIVLSNNDGCVIARSQEAKRLGIQMGVPFFKIKDFCKMHSIRVFSSNYQLYGDISNRVMKILSEMTEEMEIYSIDEAFLIKNNEGIFDFCVKIKETIKKWIGIPVSIGIAPTKTLAKVANHLAKKKNNQSIIDLRLPLQQQQALKDLPVKEIWGIGNNFSKKLNSMGIYTADMFIQCNPYQIRKKFGVVGERILWELKGLSCLPLNEIKPKKSIICSRSFGVPILCKEEMYEAIATYASRAAVQLREQQHCVQVIYVFIETVFNIVLERRQITGTTYCLQDYTNDTLKIITGAKSCIDKLYKKGISYKKCGIVMLDLIPADAIVPDLFRIKQDQQNNLMSTMDAINNRFGKDTLKVAAMGFKQKWKMQSNLCSRRYTTNWKELALVNAK